MLVMAFDRAATNAARIATATRTHPMRREERLQELPRELGREAWQCNQRWVLPNDAHDCGVTNRVPWRRHENAGGDK